MDNKLLLAVNFLGVDKLSGALKNIVGGAKSGSDSMREMQREIRLMEKDLARVERQMSKGGGAGLSMAQRELKEAIARTNAELETQTRKMERIATIQGGATKVADVAGSVGSRATVLITAPLVAFGTAATRAAIDAEELQSAFNVTFGKNAALMNRWAMEVGNAMGRSITEMQKGANTFGIFFNQAAPADKAAAMSKQFAILAQDLGSFFNTDTQTAIDKLRSGLSGESEPLRDFGVFLTEAKVKAQAMAMGLKPVNGELTEQQKIMARYALIMAETKNAQGDVARTSASTANQIRASQAAWENLQVVVGQKLIPAITPLISQLASVFEWFGQLSPGTQGVIVKIAALVAVVGPLMMGISAIASGVSMLAPLLPMLGTAFTLMTGPIGLVVVAIAAVAYAIYANWDRIKAAFASGWAAVKSTLAAAPEWLKSLGGMMMSGLLSMIDPFGLRNRLLEVARNGVAAFKSFFGIKSPSRLMMGMGGYITEGLSLGLDKGRGAPLRSMGRIMAGVGGAAALGLAAPAGATAAPGAGGASGRAAAPAMAVTYNVTIQISGADAGDPKAAAAAIKRELDALLAVEARGSYADA